MILKSIPYLILLKAHLITGSPRIIFLKIYWKFGNVSSKSNLPTFLKITRLNPSGALTIYGLFYTSVGNKIQRNIDTIHGYTGKQRQ